MVNGIIQFHHKNSTGLFCYASLRAAGVPLLCDKRGEYQLWQRRFWEHTIRDERDHSHHVDYIHYNPVKHGLVRQVADWPYSSFHRYVRQGLLSDDWADHHLPPILKLANQHFIDGCWVDSPLGNPPLFS